MKKYMFLFVKIKYNALFSPPERWPLARHASALANKEGALTAGGSYIEGKGGERSEGGSQQQGGADAGAAVSGAWGRSHMLWAAARVEVQ